MKLKFRFMSTTYMPCYECKFLAKRIQAGGSYREMCIKEPDKHVSIVLCFVYKNGLLKL